jgi:DNA-binding IclR family transcriptional regulator
LTPHTITRPGPLHAELAAILRTGIGADREEFREDFCCLAAPVLDDRARFLAVVGISMSRRAFDTEREALETALPDVSSRSASNKAGVTLMNNQVGYEVASVMRDKDNVASPSCRR